MPERLSQLLPAQVEPVTSLAQTLQTYGAWGIVAVLLVALAYLWRAYVTARDKRDAENMEQVKAALGMVEECTKTSVEMKNALVSTKEALQAIERRLEAIERGG